MLAQPPSSKQIYKATFFKTKTPIAMTHTQYGISSNSAWASSQLHFLLSVPYSAAFWKPLRHLVEVGRELVEQVVWEIQAQETNTTCKVTALAWIAFLTVVPRGSITPGSRQRLQVRTIAGGIARKNFQWKRNFQRSFRRSGVEMMIHLRRTFYRCRGGRRELQRL